MKNLKIIEVTSEIGAGTRGSSLGPAAIRIAALNYNSDFFNLYPSLKIPDENDSLFNPVISPYAKRIGNVCKMYERVSAAVMRTIQDGQFPILLSGDHSTAGATIAGIKMARPDARVGVIWFDAHADLHTPYTTPSGNMHGMALATAVGEDNTAMSDRQLDEDTKEKWNAIKNTGNISPKLAGEDIVLLSLRDFEREEKDLIEKLRIRVVTTAEVRLKGTEEIVKFINQYLSKCTHIYISFDVDSLDSSISKGTGTPVSGGLMVREAEELVSELMYNSKVCCFEIAEINPTLDKENAMAEVAFHILQQSVNVLLKN